MRLDNPLLVRWEYASEERVVKRNEIFRNVVEGDNPEEVAFTAVGEAVPKRLLDVGCGPGDLTQRFATQLGAEVKAVDISPRMIELTRLRGIDAQLADAEQLPFGDGEFDCVFAGWVLYHVPDIPKAISECARVLARDGRLVATLAFPDTASMRSLVASTMDRAHLAPLVPDVEGPCRATTRHVVFVAERPL